MVKYSKINKTFDDWVELISNKFGGNTFEVADIIQALDIINPDEINLVTKAYLTVFAKQHNVLTFLDACNKLGISSELPKLRNKQDVANYKLSVIIEVLNDGWKPNWTNTSEYKYFPWFNVVDGVFGYYGWSYCHAESMFVPSALCLKTKQLTYFVGNYYLDLYRDLFM